MLSSHFWYGFALGAGLTFALALLVTLAMRLRRSKV
jgi:hypothetical protein